MLWDVLKVPTLSTADLLAQRPPEAGADDVHFPQALVRAVIAEYTVPGDTVLDPFAGFGTTLAVAHRMDRRAAGVELLGARVRAIRRQVPAAVRVIEGDARRLADLPIGPVHLCLTSPPYMTEAGHPENPLTAYTTLDGNYSHYLVELGAVFAAVGRLLVPGGHLVVNAANLDSGGMRTPLAWDIVAVVGHPLIFRLDLPLNWDRPRPGIAGDYCLVFRRDG